MEKNKEVVTPIDETEFLTEEQKRELERKHNVKVLIKPSPIGNFFGILLVIWFIVSVVSMIYLSEINTQITIIIFGQVFFVFGLIAFFAKDAEGKRFSLISLPFIIVGLLCIIIPLTMLFPKLMPVRLNWEAIVPILMLVEFMIVGVVLMLGLLKGKGSKLIAVLFGGFFITFPAFALSLFLSEEPQLILTDKEPQEQETETYYEDEETTYKEYKIGEKVKVKLNNVLQQEFYVLSNSDIDKSTVTLFAAKNIGYSAYNNNYTDGHEFTGSLIQTKLDDLTKTWTNVKEKRLIKKEEIINTNLVYDEKIYICADGDCEKTDTFVKKDSFLYQENEIYWTMTPAKSSTTDKGYVFIVDKDGKITESIVGYKPGEELNKDGKYFENYGIRPVIVIHKNFIV